ncbi:MULTISPECIES: hypothetical protein [Thermomonospora]|uniref:ThiamineS protein n=1 Tax=Thermomonospora curvata (strain ATCC 19995 / DSM 43183 / JCM 3096 / KCTC 9072 / NBRC 15933 / NCIMB 10081 / Henssen B9) TaxID=471852 RepID=D1AEW4_THECD|nr:MULTISPECIES: hypothetical protein [Thermomonospora]ACY97689.1 hypothetical protein Tcur_2123 [Thermomonospora curvata DSM 43183]PKK14432.1 MAG: hypothetical protein BUE48_010375 [Thermomonospora sp. CIF 1]TNY35352.1 hypothetical protein EIO00_19125 [Thermomonospora catenispora]
MTLCVHLLGYPEAVLATDTITLDAPPDATADYVVRQVATLAPGLDEALLHEDGSPRQTTKVMVHGVPVAHRTPIGREPTVTVLASLPCDG